MWADFLNDHPILGVFIFVLLSLPILSQVSPKAHCQIKMFMYYLSIMVASVLGVPASIPSYFQNGGGKNAFTMFMLSTFWMDVEYEVRNRERLEEPGSAVLVSNHQSSLDVLTMGHAWPERCTCMMKKSLKYVPLFNFACMLSNAIYVDRFNKERAHGAMTDAVETILSKNLKIWVFPEGTRFRGKGMLSFKKGAFNIAVEAQIPIVPIVISYYGNFYNANEKTFKNRGQVIMQVLKPISTKGLTHDDVPVLTEQVRDAMMEEFEKISQEVEKKQKQVDEQRTR